jgi:thioredoxin reductase
MQKIDTLIVGAGPAGLQLAYFLEQSGRDYLVLDRQATVQGGFGAFPRHRKLISLNKVYTGETHPDINMRWDWNGLLCDEPALEFRNFSERYFPDADDMCRYLSAFAEHYRLKIESNVEVAHIARPEGKNEGFVVTDTAGRTYACERLVMATGISKPYLPQIPGIDLAECYFDVTVDPKDFINQHVLIIGKGNSGFETADNLIETTASIHIASPHPLTMAWKSHFVGHLRAVNNNFLDTYQLKAQNAVLDATIENIEKQGSKYAVTVSYAHADGEREVLYYDRVIACTGFRFDADVFAPEIRPELVHNQRFPLQTSAWESVNVAGLHFAGTVTQMRDFKKSSSGFVHGFRYNAKALHRILAARHHDTPLESRTVLRSAEALAGAIVERINTTSALWQQFGYLGDLLALGEKSAEYIDELPVDYLQDSGMLGAHALVVTLEFGKITSDPFAIDRKPHPDQADKATFLHPVIRHYRHGELVDELHLLENLYGRWVDADLHVAPLVQFLDGVLAAPAETALAA